MSGSTRGERGAARLADAMRKLGTLLDRRQVLSQIPKLCLDVVKADIASVLASVDGKMQVVQHVGIRAPWDPYEALVLEAIAEQRPRLALPTPKPGTGRLIVVPIHGITALAVAQTASRGRLNHDDLHRLETLAAGVSHLLKKQEQGRTRREDLGRIEALMNAVQDGVVTINLDLCVLAANRHAQALLDVEEDDIIGERIHRIPSLQPVAVALTSRRVLASGEWVEVNGRRIRVRACPHPGGMVVCLSDAEPAVSVSHWNLEDIVGRHATLLATVRKGQQLADSEAPVFIRGPAGSGKRMLAHGIHAASLRRAEPFTEWDGQPPDAGTLYVPAVDQLDYDEQALILGLIEQADVRVIASSCREESRLSRLLHVELLGWFAKTWLELPALAVRKGDLPLLARAFVEQHCRRVGRGHLGIASDWLEELETEEFPDNVRGLRLHIEAQLSVLPHDTLVLSSEASRAKRAQADAG